MEGGVSYKKGGVTLLWKEDFHVRREELHIRREEFHIRKEELSY